MADAVKWGSKERMALVAEILRQKRMVRWFAEYLAETAELDIGGLTADEWIHIAEKDVETQISPEA